MSGKQSADEQIKWWWNGITYQMRLWSNHQTRLEKDGMDVENTSVTGSSKKPTLLDTSLLNKNRWTVSEGKWLLPLCVSFGAALCASQNPLSHLPRLSSLSARNIISTMCWSQKYETNTHYMKQIICTKKVSYSEKAVLEFFRKR